MENLTNAKQFDAIVIGSGFGDSTAAAYSAAAGQQVLLLERYSVLGGSSHIFRRQGRREFRATALLRPHDPTPRQALGRPRLAEYTHAPGGVEPA